MRCSWEYAWYRPRNLWGWAQNKVERLQIVARWLPVIWWDADFDHAYLWRVLAHKLTRMAIYAERHGHLASSPRQAREMRVAAALCRRIEADDYPPGSAQRDLDYLTTLMRRKALTWWD